MNKQLTEPMSNPTMPTLREEVTEFVSELQDKIEDRESDAEQYEEGGFDQSASRCACLLIDLRAIKKSLQAILDRTRG